MMNVGWGVASRFVDAERLHQRERVISSHKSHKLQLTLHVFNGHDDISIADFHRLRMKTESEITTSDHFLRFLSIDVENEHVS